MPEFEVYMLSWDVLTWEDGGGHEDGSRRFGLLTCFPFMFDQQSRHRREFEFAPFPMSSEHASTRVNSRHLNEYVGRTVRLVCKCLSFQGENAIVETSDGGQVEVRLHRDSNMADTYVEVIGSVIDATTVKMMACINLGSDLDMKLVDDVIELIHDPRFRDRMFV